jgi:hypothetical protein
MANAGQKSMADRTDFTVKSVPVVSPSSGGLVVSELPLWTGRQQMVAFDAGLFPTIERRLPRTMAVEFAPTLRVAAATLHAIGDPGGWERWAPRALETYSRARAGGADEATAMSAAIAAVFQGIANLAVESAQPELASHDTPADAERDLFGSRVRA